MNKKDSGRLKRDNLRRKSVGFLLVEMLRLVYILKTFNFDLFGLSCLHLYYKT